MGQMDLGAALPTVSSNLTRGLTRGCLHGDPCPPWIETRGGEYVSRDSVSPGRGFDVRQIRVLVVELLVEPLDLSSGQGALKAM